jgi:xanthine dehydrogenase iron-sulfur cluster and FAD-binding subunit A
MQVIASPPLDGLMVMLCRCFGFDPIVAAAVHLADLLEAEACNTMP